MKSYYLPGRLLHCLTTNGSKKYTLPPIIMVQWKITHLKTKRIFQDPIFHFHDYGRKIFGRGVFVEEKANQFVFANLRHVREVKKSTWWSFRICLVCIRLHYSVANGPPNSVMCFLFTETEWLHVIQFTSIHHSKRYGHIPVIPPRVFKVFVSCLMV